MLCAWLKRKLFDTVECKDQNTYSVYTGYFCANIENLLIISDISKVQQDVHLMLVYKDQQLKKQHNVT